MNDQNKQQQMSLSEEIQNLNEADLDEADLDEITGSTKGFLTDPRVVPFNGKPLGPLSHQKAVDALNQLPNLGKNFVGTVDHHGEVLIWPKK
jgi:hypothetical protein